MERRIQTTAECKGRMCLSVVQCLSHLKASEFTCCVYGSVTKSVTDAISRLHLDKYYFPLLKVSALLFQVFI